MLRTPGALVRRGIALSSEAVRVLPHLAVAECSERVTIARGVTRLRLADGTGWVSEATAGPEPRAIMRAL